MNDLANRDAFSCMTAKDCRTYADANPNPRCNE